LISDLLLKADRAVLAEQFALAEQLSRQALAIDSENLLAITLLGISQAKTNDFQGAYHTFESLCQLDPESLTGAQWMARCARRLGHIQEAVEYARRAVRLQPENTSFLHQLGLSLLDSQDFLEAQSIFEAALRRTPTVPNLYVGLGNALTGQGRNSDAISVFQQALDLSPRFPAALEALARAWSTESAPLESLECARLLVQVHPSKEARLQLAQSLASAAQPEEARHELKTLESLPIDSAEFLFAIGSLWLSLGDVFKAREAFARSIAIRPDQGSAYAGLAYSRSADRASLEEVAEWRSLASSGHVENSELGLLNFAIGKAQNDLGEFKEAMASFKYGNETLYLSRFKFHEFDRELYRSRIDQKILSGGGASEAGSDSILPIFVVGMQRSGTTLLEQMLSAHPTVGGAGELGFWLHHRDSSEAPPSLASSYLRLLADLFPDKSRVVDKMPDNYLELGAISNALPRAKIVHCRRHPVDTCLSIYTTMNRLGIDWQFHKGDITFVYQQYLLVMEHWRRILPKENLLEIDYEDLVTSPVSTMRQVLEFCGIEWDERCAKPEENTGPVGSLSAWQVRQPLYQTSIGRWKSYEPWLEEFAGLLSVRTRDG
jgi:tetratricopeptide (TPR) repeat protein